MCIISSNDYSAPALGSVMEIAYFQESNDNEFAFHRLLAQFAKSSITIAVAYTWG